ncbi:MAG: MATE family efflux transporter [Rhodospirillales bacterium]|nr:MATE family efflux transporter [Rhodospirillales bacterium]
MLSQLAIIGQSVVLMVLAGHRGAAVLGAVAIGTNVWNLAIMAMVGTMMALSPSVSQLDGAGRRGETGALFRQALWLGLALGMVLGAAMFAGGPALAAAMGVDAALLPGVRAFLHAMSFGAPAVSLFLACRGLSEGLSHPRPATLICTLGLVLLGPIGYALMFHLGLGALGAGLTEAAVVWLQLAVFALYLRGSRLYQGIGWGAGRRGPDLAAIGGLFRLGAPMAGSVLMEVGMFSATALLVGRFGAAAIASHQIALSVASVSFMVPLGLAMAITVRVGHAVGRGDAIGVRRAAYGGMALALTSQAIACAAMLTLPGRIASLYTDDPTVLRAAVGLLFLAALFQLSDGVQVACNGALRGLKDARAPMLITMLAYWGVGMPVGWALAFPAGGRTPGMWVGLIAGLSVAAILLLARFRIVAGRVAAE